MRIQGIIHQQICQLKWHILACFGLIMVLPIEEAVVSLKDGFGFQSSGMVIVSAMFAPLLAGLIACANVQGDLNDKIYIFWRSKPAGIKLLIALKYFIGLVISYIILACPLVFGIITVAFSKEKINDSELITLIPLSLLLTIMTYSLCFGCNVLVRSTARSWLMGMLLTGFFLVLPILLPLDYTDYFDLFDALYIYLTITLIASSAAVVFALFAAQYDWHLRTNLKGLLWVVAGLVFVLMMLFSSQVANIKVLQEKETDSYRGGWYSLDYVGDRILFQNRSFVDIDNNKISFSNIESSTDDIIFPITRMEGYSTRIYPVRGRLIKEVGDDLYCFIISAYYSRKGKTEIYEKVYLRSYKFTGKMWIDVGELDISDCLVDSRYPQIAMRLIGDKIIAFVNKSFVVVDVTDPGELKTIHTKHDVLQNRLLYNTYYRERGEKFAIPLIPVEGISIEEKIKLSIDWYCHPSDMYETSIVDIHDDKFAFFLVDDDDIARFDVARWDKENIYCELRATRPFTILEFMTGKSSFNYTFVESGKLYCCKWHTLMVFDIRSDRRIRKLGHFVRTDYGIFDIAVMEDGNILLCVQKPNFMRISSNERKKYLYLLKSPE